MADVKIPEAEYKRLKKIERDFSVLRTYTGHVRDIATAREESKRGDGISQEELELQLGV